MFVNRESNIGVALTVTERNAGLPTAADLYGDIETTEVFGLRALAPGLTVAAMAVLAAGFISEHYGAPLTLMGLLVGLSVNFLGKDRSLLPGLDLASSGLLRLGIVLLGARITLAQIVNLGPETLLCVLLVAAITIGVGIALAYLFDFDWAFGMLAGGAVAICGASAALALAAVLGGRRASREQLLIVLIGISALSAATMLLYPIIAHELRLGDRQAGFFLGASIHDVAQSLAAGYSFSDQAGQTATIVKLTRVALLVPLLALLGFFVSSPDGTAKRRTPLPWFVLGFLFVAGMNSINLLGTTLAGILSTTGSILVATSLTAAAVRSPIGQIVNHGWRPLLVIAGATLAAGGSALMCGIWL